MKWLITCVIFLAFFLEIIEARVMQLASCSKRIKISSQSGTYQNCSSSLQDGACRCYWEFNFTEDDKFVFMNVTNIKLFEMNLNGTRSLFHHYSGHDTACFEFYNLASNCSISPGNESQCIRYDVFSDIYVDFFTKIPSNDFQMSYEYIKCSQGTVELPQSTTVATPIITTQSNISYRNTAIYRTRNDIVIEWTTATITTEKSLSNQTERTIPGIQIAAAVSGVGILALTVIGLAFYCRKRAQNSANGRNHQTPTQSFAMDGVDNVVYVNDPAEQRP